MEETIEKVSEGCIKVTRDEYNTSVTLYDSDTIVALKKRNEKEISEIQQRVLILTEENKKLDTYLTEALKA